MFTHAYIRVYQTPPCDKLSRWADPLPPPSSVTLLMNGPYVTSQHTDDKSPLKEHGQSHVTHFKFWGPNDISGTRIVKFGTHVDCIKS